jgi:hypothetical protein
LSAARLRHRTGLAGASLIALALGIARPPAAVGQQTGAPADGPTIAVIVNPSNSIDHLSTDALRRFYLGTSTVFSASGERVVLYEQGDLRERFYHTMLRMSGDRVKRHWIGVVFAGLGATPPTNIVEPALLRDLVASHRGALGFVDALLVDGSVKALAIDGLLPGDAGYPLRAAAAAPQAGRRP